MFTFVYWFYVIINRKDVCLLTVNGAQDLVKLFLSVLLISDFQIDILKSSITLLLYALCKMEILVAQKVLDGSEVDKVFKMCEIALQDWIKRRGVVGGSFFGYRAQGGMKLLYGLTELKVCFICLLRIIDNDIARKVFCN